MHWLRINHEYHALLERLSSRWSTERSSSPTTKSSIAHTKNMFLLNFCRKGCITSVCQLWDLTLFISFIQHGESKIFIHSAVSSIHSSGQSKSDTIYIFCCLQSHIWERDVHQFQSWTQLYTGHKYMFFTICWHNFFRIPLRMSLVDQQTVFNRNVDSTLYRFWVDFSFTGSTFYKRFIYKKV